MSQRLLAVTGGARFYTDPAQVTTLLAHCLSNVLLIVPKRPE